MVLVVLVVREVLVEVWLARSGLQDGRYLHGIAHDVFDRYGGRSQGRSCGCGGIAADDKHRTCQLHRHSRCKKHVCNQCRRALSNPHAPNGRCDINEGGDRAVCTRGNAAVPTDVAADPRPRR